MIGWRLWGCDRGKVMENTRWPCVDWKEVWSKMRGERLCPLRITYDENFRKQLLSDEIAKNRASNYEYGRKVVENLTVLLNSDFDVLEIGAGLGTLTVPLSEKVKAIRSVEISPERVSILREELRNRQISNVEVIEEDWMKIAKYEVKEGFDLVICSHFLWQVEDLEAHLEKMEKASKKFCAIIQPSGRDAIVRDAYETIVSDPYQGQFEPDADIFPYIILRHKGRLLNTGSIEYTVKRDRQQLVRYVASFIGRYMEVDKKVGETIADLAARHMQNGFHIERCRSVIIWWKVDSV